MVSFGTPAGRDDKIAARWLKTADLVNTAIHILAQPLLGALHAPHSNHPARHPHRFCWRVQRADGAHAPRLAVHQWRIQRVDEVRGRFHACVTTVITVVTPP